MYLTGNFQFVFEFVLVLFTHSSFPQFVCVCFRRCVLINSQTNVINNKIKTKHIFETVPSIVLAQDPTLGS